MAEHWFYIESLPQYGEKAHLEEREAHHAAKVRRMRPGDEVRLFDGRGGVATGRMQNEAAKRGVLSVAIESVMHEPPPSPSLHLAAALPSGQNLTSTMLSMAVQVGMSAFTPLVCERSAKLRFDARARDRWNRIFIESCKQSRRPHVPSIGEPRYPREFALEQSDRGSASIFGHPDGHPLLDILDALDASTSIALLVGPEGGFTDAEVDAMKGSGAHHASLGDGILRIETAAVLMLAAAMLKTRTTT